MEKIKWSEVRKKLFIKSISIILIITFLFSFIVKIIFGFTEKCQLLDYFNMVIITVGVVTLIVYLIFYKKTFWYGWIFTIILAVIIVLWQVSITWIQPYIEECNTIEEIEFDNFGSLNFSVPILENGTYTGIINLSLHNSIKYNFENVKFHVKFNSWEDLHYNLTDYYPKDESRINSKLLNPNETYFEWDEIKDGETFFLLFSVNWSEERGGHPHTPVDFASSTPCANINIGSKKVGWFTGGI